MFSCIVLMAVSQICLGSWFTAPAENLHLRPDTVRANVELGSPFVKNYTPEDYGAGPMNWAIVQGKNGLLYFANEKGVLEYDGMKWRLIETDKRESVRSMAVDDQGVIYIGGRGEFGYLDSDSTGSTVFRSLSDRLDKSDKKFQDIWSTHATSHGVYFITLGKIFHFYRNELRVIENSGENIGFSVGDDVYVFHMQGGLSRLHNGKLWPLPETGIFSRDNTGRIAITAYSPDKLLIATDKKGGFIYHIGSTKPNDGTSSLLQAFPTQADEYFRQNFLYYFATRTKEGVFIYPTIQGGIVFIDRHGKLIRIVNENHGFNSTGVTAVFVDKDQNLWAVSTIGISYLEISSPWGHFETAKGMRSPILTIKRHKETLYLGTLKGVFTLPKYEEYPIDNPHNLVPLKDIRNQCYVLYSFEDTLLAGADNEIYEIRGNRAYKLATLKKHRWIYSMGRSKKFPNTIFVGMYSGGLATIKISRECSDQESDSECAENRIKADILPFQFEEFADESIRTILEDDRGDLWLLSYEESIIRIMFTGDDVKQYKIVRYGIESGLPSLHNNMIDWIDNQLMVVNSKGIYRASEQSGRDGEKATRFVPCERLLKALPTQIGELQGIYELGDDLIVDGLDSVGVLKKKPDGSYSWDSSQFGAILTTRDTIRPWHVDPDRVIFLAIYGVLYRLDPNIYKDYKVDYPAFIRKVVTAAGDTLFNGNYDNASQILIGDDSRRTMPKHYEKSLPKLEYRFNSMAFEFSAAFYEQASKNLFRYKLDGFDKEWSQWSLGGKKEYTNLPEGAYAFSVEAKNVFGKKSQKALYRFVILPPWYRTIWAYVGYIIASLVILIGGMRLYFNRLLKAKKKLEGIVRYRTAQLQESLDKIKQQRSQDIEENMSDLKKTQALLEVASQRAGTAELATSVLHNVSNVLTSVNISSNILKEKLSGHRVSRLQDLVKLFDEHQEDLSDFFSKDAKGKMIPQYLQMLEKRLSQEQQAMMDEMSRLQSSIDHIKTIVGVQQSHAVSAGVLEKIALVKLIDEALVMSGVSVYSNEIKIVKEICYWQPIPVEAHSVLQILINLMNNAKHSLRSSQQDKKVMTINIEKISPDQICIKISDNGEGVSEEAMAKLFTYGFTTKGDGHGFGLHQSAVSAKEMGGSLTCHSDGEGKGASFQLELPIIRVNGVEQKPSDQSD